MSFEDVLYSGKDEPPLTDAQITDAISHAEDPAQLLDLGLLRLEALQCHPVGPGHWSFDESIRVIRQVLLDLHAW